MGVTTECDSVSVWDDEKIHELDGDSCTQCECALCHITVHLKMDETVNFMLCVFYYSVE